MTHFVNRPARRASVVAASAAARKLAIAVLGDNPPLHMQFPDGSTVGPPDAAMRVNVRSTDAFVHLLRAPGELGLARAYVSGEVDIEGDITQALAANELVQQSDAGPLDLVPLARALGSDLFRNPPPIPPEEMVDDRLPRLSRHTKGRDAQSISHHYDVSNDFYKIILGPSMVYSCAVFESAQQSLDKAQENKVELICRKLGLQPGMRLLDVGCGWGTMVIHAARHYGVHAVGITISKEQHALAQQRVKDAGLEHLVEIRLQDYRDIDDGPFDAISSIGMFEHVGASQLEAYFERLRSLLREGGRLLNHQIGRPPQARTRLGRERTAINRRGFMHRYVFPNGELHEVGSLTRSMQEMGFEVRHMESLREHYARTLQQWCLNLDDNWDEAVKLVGEGRARVWKLYMATSGAAFAMNRIQVHQILGVATNESTGVSKMPWRPTWETNLASPGDHSRDGDRSEIIDLRSPSPLSDQVTTIRR